MKSETTVADKKYVPSPVGMIEIPRWVIAEFDAASDDQVCARVNEHPANPFWFYLAVRERENIFFSSKSGCFVVRDASVCNCPLRCLDYETHRLVSGFQFT